MSAGVVLDADDGGSAQEAVERGGRRHEIAGEDVAPLGEGAFGR